jgi:CysZ protein
MFKVEIVRNNPLSRFSRGFFYPFHGARYLLRHPRLLRFIAIPFAINTLVFSGALYLGLHFFEHIATAFIPHGDAWYWVMLSYLFWGLAVLLTAVLVFFSFTVVGNLIASPFNDMLSERTEELITGRCREESFSFAGFWHDTRRTLGVEIRKLTLFVLGMVVLLGLNLLPVVGSLLYSILSVVWTIFFLVVEYLGFVFARKRLSFGAQRRFVLARPALMAGFGTGVLVILAIPLLQLLCIPVAVVGATLLYCELADQGPERSAQH